jgi:hypothetical protein
MTLGFSQEIKGVKNFFVEKIWNSLNIENDANEEISSKIYHDWLYRDKELNPKLHTIRDGVGRWRSGIDIHMVINNRTKNRFQFAPTIKCKSVQKIEIKWTDSWPYVKIDGKGLMYDHDYKILAINDGFDSVDDFFAYFNKDFTGTLIHWTDLKY